MKGTGGGILLRAIAIILLVIFQISAFVIVFLFFTEKTAYFYVSCIILSLIVTLVIVRRDSSPEYKIAWIIPILLLPLFGGPFYLLFGRIRPTRRERRRSETVDFRSRQATSAEHLSESSEQAREQLKLQNADAAIRAKYILDTACAPLFGGTSTQYFALGDDMYPKLLEDLQNAQKSIFMEYFIIRPGMMWGSILDILKSKAAQGVDVRIMYDDFGCMFILPYGYPKKLEAMGIKCCVFNRFSNILSSARFNNRDHRKMCIIDSNIGYTGGINISDEYINQTQRFGHWKDTAIRVEGDAVWSMTVMFLSLWCYTAETDENFLDHRPSTSREDNGYVQPFTDIPMDSDAVGEVVYKQILGRAKRWVYITTPYLIAGSTLITALTDAAKSGIDVRIITPGIPDKKTVFFMTRSYYEVLLNAGVKIYEYSPGFMHSKTIASDDDTAVVGTINLDYRSLYLHYECGVMLYGTETVAAVRDDFLDTLTLSREVTLEDCKELSFVRRVILSILRVFAPLM